MSSLKQKQKQKQKQKKTTTKKNQLAFINNTDILRTLRSLRLYTTCKLTIIVSLPWFHGLLLVEEDMRLLGQRQRIYYSLVAQQAAWAATYFPLLHPCSQIPWEWVTQMSPGWCMYMQRVWLMEEESWVWGSYMFGNEQSAHLFFALECSVIAVFQGYANTDIFEW